jgi:hypothetical protein
MKSQVNLLDDRFRPHFQSISAGHLISLSIFILVLGGFLSAYTYYESTKLQDGLASVELELSSERKIIDELTVAITSRQTSPLLASKLDNLIALSNSRNAVLSELQSLSNLKQRSFSKVFDSFIVANSDKLWITDFRVSPQILTINGGISAADALPVWVNSLSKTSFFSGQEFDSASVERNGELLLFSLNSSRKSREQETGNVASTSDISSRVTAITQQSGN